MLKQTLGRTLGLISALLTTALLTVQSPAEKRNPGLHSDQQLAKLGKSKLKAVYLPTYLPEGFRVEKLDLSPGEYRLFYCGPAKADFSIWGRNQGVADGGPSDLHYPIKAGPFRNNQIEFNRNKTGFYTGFMRIVPEGGELEPSFDVEGHHIAPQQALKIVESLRKL